MLSEAISRTQTLLLRLSELGISHADFTSKKLDWLSCGLFLGGLGVDFGRPSMLVVRARDAPVGFTPLMNGEMVAES